MVSLENAVRKTSFYSTLFFIIFSVTGCGSSSSSAADPENMYIAPRDHSVAILCNAETEGDSAEYQWYESTDGKTSSGIAIQNATDLIFTTPVFTEKGIRYYYCTAASKGKTSVSNVSSVAFTGLPTLYINTPDRAEITKENWSENALISIVGANDSDWNFDNVETSIKGRGNAAWERPKKPYTLKLQEERKIMEMPKNKRWILVENYRDGSFMRNETALYLSEILKFDWTVHGEFVDFVLNGRYMGLYWLGETVKVDENRVNISDGNEDIENDEDKDYLLEAEEELSDDPLSFKSAIRGITYTVQNDDFMLGRNEELSTGGKARLERLKAKINTVENLLYPDFKEGMDTDECPAPNEAYVSIIDIDSWIKFWLVNEIMDNKKLETPEDCFFTFESKKYNFKAGPVWDFDSSSGKERSSCTLTGTVYFNALFKSPVFVSRTKELWNEYSSLINTESRIKSMKNKISVAAEYDIMRWGKHHDNPTSTFLDTFDEEVDFLKKTVSAKISAVNKFIENL